MFAVRDDDYPGGWFYRFQYHNPEEGEILRYDDAHDDPDLGWHHRHVRFGEDTEIEFGNLGSRITLFLREIAAMTTTEDDTDD